MQNIQASQKVVQFHCKITDAANPIPDVMPDMPCIMNPWKKLDQFPEVPLKLQPVLIYKQALEEVLLVKIIL